MTSSANAPDLPGLPSRINRIAGLLEHGGGVISAGDAAALRRMDPHRPAAAFYKVIALALGDGAGASVIHEDDEIRWAAILVSLAHLGDLHRPGVDLGGVLADLGYSELRFARLLRADAERLIDELPMLARFLSAKGAPADWADAAFLILSEGRSDEQRVRRRLARSYYGSLARNDNT